MQTGIIKHVVLTVVL